MLCLFATCHITSRNGSLSVSNLTCLSLPSRFFFFVCVVIFLSLFSLSFSPPLRPNREDENECSVGKHCGQAVAVSRDYTGAQACCLCRALIEHLPCWPLVSLKYRSTKPRRPQATGVVRGLSCRRCRMAVTGLQSPPPQRTFYSHPSPPPPPSPSISKNIFFSTLYLLFLCTPILILPPTPYQVPTLI